MRALVDTSVWIDFYHPKGNAAVKRHLAHALEHDDVAVAPPIVTELLAGTRSDKESEQVLGDLQAVRLLPLAWDEAVTAGRFARVLASSGQRIPLVDLLIAAAGYLNNYEVWHSGDEHFATIAKVGGPVQRNLRQAGLKR